MKAEIKIILNNSPSRKSNGLNPHLCLCCGDWGHEFRWKMNPVSLQTKNTYNRNPVSLIIISRKTIIWNMTAFFSYLNTIFTVQLHEKLPNLLEWIS